MERLIVVEVQKSFGRSNLEILLLIEDSGCHQNVRIGKLNVEI